MSQSHRPSGLAEALALRAEKTLTPYDGGTDLMPGHRRWMGLKPDLDGLLFIGHLPELQEIAVENGGPDNRRLRHTVGPFAGTLARRTSWGGS